MTSESLGRFSAEDIPSPSSGRAFLIRAAVQKVCALWTALAESLTLVAGCADAGEVPQLKASASATTKDREIRLEFTVPGNLAK
jgi:hypothetical protein